MSVHRDDDGETRLPDGEDTDLTTPAQPRESSAKSGERAAAARGPRRAAGSGSPRTVGDSAQFSPGEAFGARYLIIKLLGMGGMGAVYQAWDQELGVAVALKVIRPEATPDPKAAAEMERRFKRELLLARQVTHTNVVRIHDLGELNGIKYISMPYVEGEDLSTRLKREARLGIKDALTIARQVGAGLEAAHQAGVVHRDLKPANIMIGADGHVLIMDFGIARLGTSSVPVAPPPAQLPPSLAGIATGTMTLDVTPAPASFADTMRGFGETMAPSGGAQAPASGAASFASMTRGAIVGTVAYMAPEQARAGAVDHRADIYAFGMILSEMLIGRRRTPEGLNAVEALQRRISEAPASLRDTLPAVPEALDAFVLKCLQIDPAERFQTTAELVGALAKLDDEGELIPDPVVRRWTPRTIAVGVFMLAAIVTGTWWMSRGSGVPVQHDPVSVVIADFQNNTNDPAFDRTLEPMLKRALEGAGFVTAFDRNALTRILGVRPPEKLDEVAAGEIAAKQGLGVVLSGAIERQGNAYGVSVKAAQTVSGNVLATAKARASGKEQVLEVANKLMATVRKALGDKTSDADQIFAMASLSATSLEVVRLYSAAQQAASNNKFDDVVRYAEKAVELDPTFGAGYQVLAAASRNQGRLQEAEKYTNEALRYIDNMTERERYSARGLAFRVAGDWQACVKEYGDLVARYAADPVGRNQRALCMSKLRDMRGAANEMRQVVDILPKRTTFRDNLALYSDYAGDFQTAEQEARKIEEPDSYATLALAFAQMGQGRAAEAAESYRKLRMIDDLGKTFGASGLGDLAMYEGRYSDAVKIFELGTAEDLARKNPDKAAMKFASMAYAQLWRGQKAAAIAAADKALSNSPKAVPIRFLAARVFVEAGGVAKARPLMAGLAAELQAEPQAYAKILEAEIALQSGDARAAVTTLNAANMLLDTWLGHFDLGRAYLLLPTPALPQADSEFDRCLKRRGEALSLFADEEPTYGFFPTVYYYQGQVREGLKNAGFAESYRAYLSIRSQSKEDRLAADIRRRSGG